MAAGATSEWVTGPDPADPPLYRQLVADRREALYGPPGRHRWHAQDPNDTRTEEIAVTPAGGRHGDDDADGVVNQADPDWTPDALPTPPDPVAPVGPADPDHPAYSRVGDHEPLRWPEPAPEALAALARDADDVDAQWLRIAAQPITAAGGPDEDAS